jgi:hypothetical protein
MGSLLCFLVVTMLSENIVDPQLCLLCYLLGVVAQT